MFIRAMKKLFIKYVLPEPFISCSLYNDINLKTTRFLTFNYSSSVSSLMDHFLHFSTLILNCSTSQISFGYKIISHDYQITLSNSIFLQNTAKLLLGLNRVNLNHYYVIPTWQ